MSKNIFFGLAIAALGFASCSEDFTDWVDLQHNGAEAVQTTEISVSPVAAIDLATVTTPTVKVFNGEFTSSEETVKSVELTLSNGTESKAIATDLNGEVAVDELSAIVTALYGKRPTARTMDATVEAYFDKNGQTVREVGTTSVTVTPIAPVIYDHLYIIGAPSEWSTTCTTLPFTHSDKDVYDDPVFTATFPVTADGDIWFAITDDYTVSTEEWGNVFGCMEGNGNNLIGEKGKLGRRVEKQGDDCSFKVSVAGDAKFIKVTVDMLDGWYLIEKINYAPYFYAIGGDTGWSSCYTLYCPEADGNYTGYGYLSQEFKFKPNADNWDGDLEFISDNKVGDVGGPNCPAPAAGFYQIKLDLTTGTYSLVQIEKVGVIGGFNGWGGDEFLTYNQAENCWEGDVTFAEGTEYKFRANSDWAINWGGEANALWENGGNLWADAGTYNFKLYVSYNGTSHVTITKK